MKKHYTFQLLLISVIYCSCTSQEGDDYASLTHREDWSHHYAYGSPSWDTFERFPANPVCRGSEGMEWPVNGFLFSDPQSSNWYLYIGEYKENYATDQDPETVDFKCVIYKSSDRGKTWDRSGDLFPANMVCYDSIKIQAPDVMVTYSDGKYHMVFDWVSNTFDWQHAERSGLGYASADSPEGPFTVSKEPIKINTQYKQKPLLDRYWRMYATMIIKRKDDWALVYMMDTQPARSWVLAVSTAKNPEGPYGDSQIILNVERKTNFHPLQEYFPAFTHDGYAYFPTTSVAKNRNHQAVYKVKIEDITKANKYELLNTGSLWHSEHAENEYVGIWGQTFTGFVDSNDSIYVMFPSKDKKNLGTINLAKASWNHLFREQGFNLTANEGNSFSYIKKSIDVETIDLKFDLEGTMQVVWDFHSPIDVLNGWGKFALEHENADFKEIVIHESSWKINKYEVGQKVQNLAVGKISNWKSKGNTLQLKNEEGKSILYINNEKYWEGPMQSNPGILGVSLSPQSFLYADRFVVEGQQKEGSITYGYYEALVNSGNQDHDWEFKNDTTFLIGKGAVSKKDSSFAKWNFDGKGFELYLPKGPDYGNVAIYLDGNLLDQVQLKAAKEQKSSMVYKSKTLKMESHAVYIESLDGLLPVDCIKVDI